MHKMILTMQKVFMNMHKMKVNKLTAMFLSFDMEMTSSMVSMMKNTDPKMPNIPGIVSKNKQ